MYCVPAVLQHVCTVCHKRRRVTAALALALCYGHASSKSLSATVYRAIVSFLVENS